MGALAAVKRLDLVPSPNGLSGVRGIAFHKIREMLRFVAAEWDSIVEELGGEDAALNKLGVPREDFFEVFGNDLNASPAMSSLALRLIENSPNGAPAAAIRFAERYRPRSGFLRELCLRSLNYNGRTNWDSYSTALTAGEALGRNFSGDSDSRISFWPPSTPASPIQAPLWLYAKVGPDQNASLRCDLVSSQQIMACPTVSDWQPFFLTQSASLKRSVTLRTTFDLVCAESLAPSPTPEKLFRRQAKTVEGWNAHPIRIRTGGKSARKT